MRPAKTFSPELIENGRRRYEESDEPVRSIALDFGVHEGTFFRYVTRWGWQKRGARPPRTLSPVMQLLEEARHVASPGRPARAKAAPAPAGPAAASEGDAPAVAPVQNAPPAGMEAAGTRDAVALAERMLRALEQEVSAVEAMQAHRGGGAQTPADASSAARTLESLTRSLREAQRLRGGFTIPAGFDDDDMPRDIDEFRLELARRIDAFVASRADAGAGEGDKPADGDPPGG
jgi:transposase-like protein